MYVSNSSAYHLISGRNGAVGATDSGFADHLASAYAAANDHGVADPDPVNAAALVAARQAVAEQKSWIEGNFRRSSRDLAASLPDADREKLQILVDEGKISWAEIDAGFDTWIKQVTAYQLATDGASLDKMPADWKARKDAWDVYQNWDMARREGRAAISVRYGEKVAELMAADPGPTEGTDTDPQATAKLLARQGVLDRYRQIMDQELASLDERLGAQPPRPNALPVGFNPYEMAQFEARLSPADKIAAAKLEGMDFNLSDALKDAIDHLASEIVANVARLAGD
ncbi:hypothetical protein [Dongia rigui]|uniref:Uncharacterized protein n=1 Tax=Dongia rigui TaxID=940149 RepID=A0ABU5E4A9_9PROT|nr:hypothetical protein [Dongia rigui]MDY0874478.1 hypothetical protein [Dongia rigui]